MFKVVLPLLILSVSAMAVVLLVITRPNPSALPARETAWPVRVEMVHAGAHRPVLSLQGFVEAPRLATLRAALEGDVRAVNVREGQEVESGALLVELDDRELQLITREREADLAELQAQLTIERRRIAVDRQALETERRTLALADKEVSRLEDLQADEFISPADLERVLRTREQQRLATAEREFAVASADARLAQLQARLDRVRALRDRTRLDLERSRVMAPFSGRVAGVEAAPGDRLFPGATLLTLYDTDALEIRASVPLRQLSRLHDVMAMSDVPAQARIDGRVVAVSLSRMAGTAEPGQGGLDALFTVEDSAGVVPGRFATLNLQLPLEPDSVILPFEALYETNRVYRVRDQRMEAVTVQRLGEAMLPDGRTGVLLRSTELSDGDAVVTTQLPQAMSGLRIRVIEDAPADG
ncbi:MAG: HlyD family efflux transporter periplasmic adaptor subunit [Aquisalimonadaceae bacterium]